MSTDTKMVPNQQAPVSSYGILSLTDTTCQVTNNSGSAVATVRLLSKDPKAALVMYEQPGTLLSTTDGNQTIPSGSSKTIDLSTYTGSRIKKLGDRILHPFQSKQLTVQELMFAIPGSLFPVQYTLEALNPDSKTFPPISITADSKSKMNGAFQFYQNLVAFPTSNLAVGFYTACSLSYANNDVENTMNSYLQSTKYKTDFNSFVAVATYLEMYAWAWAWASNLPSSTYWLYSVPQKNPNPNPKNKIEKLQEEIRELQQEASCLVDLDTSASLKGNIIFIKKIPPAVADPLNYDNYYDIFFKDLSGNQTQLYYERGAFTSAKGSATAPIYLLASFIAKTSLTGDFSDKSLVPFFAGTLNGSQVVGSNFQLKTSNLATANNQSTSFISKGFREILDLVVILGEIIFLVLTGNLNWKRASLLNKKLNAIKAKTGKDPTPSEVNQAKSETDSQMQEEEGRVQAQSDAAGFPKPVSSDADYSDLATQGREIITAEKIMVRTDYTAVEIVEEGKLVQLFASFGVNPTLEEATDDLYEATTALKTALNNLNKAIASQDPQQYEQAVEELNDVLFEYDDVLENVQVQLNQCAQEYANKMSSTAKNQVEKSTEISDECSKRVDDLTNEQKKIKDGTDGDDAKEESSDVFT